MLIAGKILIGLSVLGAFITLLIFSSKIRHVIINFIKTFWLIPIVLLLLAIFANNWFLLICHNATKIGMFIICLGIVGFGTPTGRKMVVLGGIISIISYFIFQIPLY